MAYDQYNVSTNGGIYAKASAVTNEAANEIADYEGTAALNMTAEHVEARGQSFWAQDAVMTRCGASINLAEVFFRPETFGTVWGITAGSGSTKEAVPAGATIYELDTSFVSLPELEYLIDIDRTSDEKKFQIWCAAGRLTGDFNIGFTQGEYIKHDVSITAFLDANNDLIHIIKEAP